MAEARFFADAMLGRLARRLRLAGWDTRYENAVADADLVRRAGEEGRIIVTRDRRLTLRRGARGAVLLTANDVAGQWRELVAALPWVTSGPVFSRCAACNAAIAPVDRDAVRERVPPYVYQTQARFFRCPGCGRVYWAGTHLGRIRDWLQP